MVGTLRTSMTLPLMATDGSESWYPRGGSDSSTLRATAALGWDLDLVASTQMVAHDGQ